MPAAPAVMDRIFMTVFRTQGLGLRAQGSGPRLKVRRLERTCPKQEVDQIALVRLHPVQLCRWNRPEIQAIDVHRVDELLSEFGLTRDRAAYKCRADRVEHLCFRTLDDGHERKHVFLLCDRSLGGFAGNEGGGQGGWASLVEG